MIILDKPYVSSFLQETIKFNHFPVVKTEAIKEVSLIENINFIDEKLFLKNLKNDPGIRIYTNSENSIDWITKNLAFTNLPDQINLFKDKVRFRKLLQNIYPGFFYKEVHIDELDNISVDDLPKPFVIKPSIGFFSMGVHTIVNEEDWGSTKEIIKNEIKHLEKLYPEVVLDTNKFIIEEFIKGDEYAFDAYFNSDGVPVVLNILKHLFSSDKDVRDRVYVTSKEIIEQKLKRFTTFLKDIGNLTGLKNFPLHVEVRIDESGELAPIEINPMRFGGWCTTADMTFYAFGINSYEYYLLDKIPKWDEILKDKAGKFYTIIVLDNSTGYRKERIKDFDYDKLLSKFSNPLELRKTNFSEYNVFGFLFTETNSENFAELEWILNSDLKEFIKLKP